MSGSSTHATDTEIDTDTETPAATLPFGKVLQVAAIPLQCPGSHRGVLWQ